MFRERALPWLARLSEGVIRSRTLRVFGMGESAVEALLRERMNALANPTLAPYAKEGEVELRITAKADTPEQADPQGGTPAVGCFPSSPCPSGRKNP